MKTPQINSSLIQKCLLPLKGNFQYLAEEEQQEKEIHNYLITRNIDCSTTFKAASILIPLVDIQQNNQWNIILTKRAKHLKHHANEVSFPGGRFEKSDIDLQTTAIRETSEEIGIDKKHIKIIGKLPYQKTISQYIITPYVAIIDPNYQIVIDYNEVEEVFLLPLEYALDHNNHQKQTQQIDNQFFSFVQLQYMEHTIWGSTARMLFQLVNRLKQFIV